MPCKKMTLRFDLDRPEDRQAWEYLQRLNPVSMNRAVLALINRAEQTDLLLNEFRAVLQEELSAAMKAAPFQPVQTDSNNDDETDTTIMDFLDSFS